VRLCTRVIVRSRSTFDNHVPRGRLLLRAGLPLLAGVRGRWRRRSHRRGRGRLRRGRPVGVVSAFLQTDYGTYCDRVILPASAVVPRPADIDPVRAAGVWMAYITAYGALAEGGDDEDLPSRVKEPTQGEGVRLAFDPIAGPGVETIAQGIPAASRSSTAPSTPVPLRCPTRSRSRPSAPARTRSSNCRGPPLHGVQRPGRQDRRQGHTRGRHGLTTASAGARMGTVRRDARKDDLQSASPHHS
jgi:hypothetical protein